MQLTINNRKQDIPDEATVRQLLEMLNLTGQHVAVERNREIVPFRTFDQTVLAEGDVLEIVTLVGGG